MIITIVVVLVLAAIGIFVAAKYPQRAVSAALALVIIGSIAFHFWTPWWWTEIASNWGGMDDTIILTFWVTGTVFCAVCLFMSYCVWKFRYLKDQKAAYEPENSKLEWGLTIFTTIGVCALLAPGLIVWDKYVDVESETGKKIVGYAKKNPKKSIIVQHDKTGHMLYLKKYDMGGES